MNKLHHSIAAALCAVVVALSASAARAAPTPRDLLAHGSPQNYSIARVQNGQAANTLKTTIQYREIAGDRRWKRIAQLSARIVSMTNRGPELAVLLDSGDWMAVWDGGSTSGALPEDGAKLRLLAGDRDELWALATAREGRTPTSAASTEPAATMPAGAPLLYELDRGQWRFVSAAPGEVSAAVDLSLVLQENAPTLAALMSDGQVRVFEYQRDRKVFEPLGESFAAPSGASRVKLLTDLGRPTLWAGDEHGVGAIFALDRDRRAWSKPIPLPLPPGASKADAQSDITVAGQSIRLLLLPKPQEDGGQITEQSFRPDGTDANVTTLPAPSSAADDQKPFDWFRAVAAAMLMMVLLNSLRAPRPVVDPEMLEHAGIALATYGTRLLAAFIDALPFIVAVVALYMRHTPQELANLDAMTDAVTWPHYIAAGAYLLHTLLTEVCFGWSIGKKICGLQVVTLDGQRPSRAAFFWRNLLRVVDVAMVFPALLVFLSPLRQRVGDVAAETIVVVKEPVEPTQDEQ